MEEYIQLKDEKAHRRGQTFNWETATYGKVMKILVSPLHDKEVDFDFKISFDESGDDDYTFIYDKNLVSYKLISVNDMKSDSEDDNDKINISSEDIVIEPSDSVINANVDTHSHEFDGFWILRVDVKRGQTVMDRLRKEQIGAEGQLVIQLLELDAATLICFQLGGLELHMSWRHLFWPGLHTVEIFVLMIGLRAYWTDSLREIATKADLRDYWSRIASDGDFLGAVPLYTSIRGPLRRLCHRLITFSISGRGQAPKKVTATDLFYLKTLWADYHEGPEERVLGDPAPVEAPQAPPTTHALSTMPQRMARLEEEVHELRRSIVGLRGGRSYQAFDGSFIGSSHMPYQRRTRRRTDGTNTSAAPHTDDQPDL
ncbi:hypothetical protein Tco_0243507 [Tanacetum coccineum]